MARPSTTTVNTLKGAAFIIRILAPNGKPANPTGLKGFQKGEFRLPIAPQSVAYDDQARMQVYAKQAGQAGADRHGMSPPIITITGTTGVGQRGGMDGYEWQLALEDIITWYAAQVEASGRLRRGMHSMEWHDLMNDQHWVVEPLATPYGKRDSSAPLRALYQLRLQALRRTTDKVQGRDVLAQALETPELCPLAPMCANPSNPAEPGCKYRAVTT